MVTYVLVAVAVMLLALWLGRRRRPNASQEEDPPFAHRPWSVDTEAPTKPPMPQAQQSPPSLPERDNWETGFLINEDKQFAVEMPAWIHYRDAKGQESRRDIVVKRLVKQEEGGEAILAFCEARKANRTFVIARILQFIDRQTGEVVTNVSDYLQTAYHESPRGRVEQALTTREAEVNVLAFIARADGPMRQKQRDAIVTYLKSAESSLIECDVELSSAIIEFWPNQTDYRKHIRDAKLKSKADRSALLAAAETLGATRSSKREFTDGALAVARKALGAPSVSKVKKA